MNNSNNQQQKINIDIAEADTMKCHDCGSERFEMQYLIKKISALLSPNGQDMVIPIQVFACSNCGIIPEEFMPASNE